MASASMSDDDLLALWLLVTQGVARVQHRISEQVEASGVPAQWVAAMHLLLEAPDRRLPMSRLARDLTMTSGGFTKLADRMAREGLIDRRGSSDDRRVVYATLTDEGVKVAKRATGLYVSALREHVLGVVSEHDLAAVSQFAQTLSDHHGPEVDDDAAAVASAAALEASRDPALPDRRGRGRATS
jgi:DNA-binding MarR family transcriptional regulator